VVPPTSKDAPTIGSNVVRLKPSTTAMPPFVMLPRPLQESQVVGKGGTSGYLGRVYNPYCLYDDPQLRPIDSKDLALNDEMSHARFRSRANLRDQLAQSVKTLEKQAATQGVDQYYQQAFDLILSGRAKKALDLTAESTPMRDRYGRHTFGQSMLLARRLIEAGTRFVQVNW